MRVLVTGAYGFIGTHVVEALQRDGAEVIGAGRRVEIGRRLLPVIAWRHADFNVLTTPSSWRPLLDGVDSIVNLVGILQSTARDDAWRIQVTATSALFDAAAAVGIRRVVHVSAISAEAAVTTDYAQTRVAAERHLAGLDLDWVIVKPSLVIGDGSFGGTALLRGLAGLPLVTPVPDVGGGRFQPIAMRDLADGLARLAQQSAPARIVLYAAGPEAKSVTELARGYRAWLGFPACPVLTVPGWLVRPALLLGDVLAYLGSPSALRTTSFEQMRYGETFEPGPFAALLGRPLATLEQIFRAKPARIQDRWHARLYLLRPILQGVLSVFWIGTGLIALLPGPRSEAMTMGEEAGLGAMAAGLVIIGGAIADIVAGALMLSARWTRVAGVLQLALSAAYLVFGTVLEPALWGDPLGPLMKVFPVIALTLAVMALAEER
ncbi:MAG: SDR family oxidoreductase [Hyphomicrobiaceae bacterium]